MIRRIFYLGLFLLMPMTFSSLLTDFASGQNNQGVPTFRISVRQLMIPIAVLKDGKMVSDLKKENIRIWLGTEKNGKTEWQEREIKNFIPYEERSIATFVLVDSSGSVSLVLEQQKAAADNFLVSLLRQTKKRGSVLDYGAIGLFWHYHQRLNILMPLGQEPIIKPREGQSVVILKGEISKLKINNEEKEIQQFGIYIIEQFKYNQDWTSDISKLKNGLVSISDAGGATNLYDALVWMAGKFDEFQPDATKVAVVITDGCDTISSHNFNFTINKLLDSQVMVFFVSVTDRERICQETIEDIAKQTGGEWFQELNPSKLDASFRKIIDQIRGVYSVSLEEPEGAGKHLIKVEIGENEKNGKWKREKGYTIHHPKQITTAKNP